MSSSALSQRLAAFRQNFKQILGPKRQVEGVTSYSQLWLYSTSCEHVPGTALAESIRSSFLTHQYTQGYGELSQLEQPLVSEDTPTETTDEYVRHHGVARPGGAAEAGAGPQGAIPSQVRKLGFRSA